jgi:uncharacterized membrane protein YeaQ/YmgE (transglycosylase-associated protein family)
MIRPARLLAQVPLGTPRLDVYEQDGYLVVEAEVPGVKKEDLQVELDNGDIVIQDETRAENEVKEYHPQTGRSHIEWQTHPGQVARAAACIHTTGKEVHKMSILGWIILGLIAGWLAGVLVKGSGYGVLGDIILGILGAIVGGWITSTLMGVDVTGFNIQSLLVAVLGAIVVIFIARLVSGARATV